MDIFIHETSIVENNVKIGDKSKIWHWTHICSGAVIGANCNIGQNVYISGSVKIGNNVKIQNNVSLYDGVIIEDNVFCGPSVVFTNVINPRSFINRKVEFRKTIIHKGASLGANSTLICGVNVGKYSLIGAGSVVTKDIKDFSLNFGNPSSHRGWVTKEGNKLFLSLNGNGMEICKKTGDKYILKNGICNYIGKNN